jgi:3-deoxy-D-manno-octulosonate 8-phosphate phosphatase (KDO 8-P phosphatase)
VSSLTNAEIQIRAASVKLAIFDVDGAMTDGRLIYGVDGDEYKAFHVRDGYGLVVLKKIGIECGVITGRCSIMVERRMAELGIRHVHQGVSDKRATLISILDKINVRSENVCYLGDDEPDIPLMKLVGLPIAVADAALNVKQVAVWTTDNAGGRGAVREVCDRLLAARQMPNVGVA